MDVDAQIRAGRALLDTLHLKESEPIVGTNDPIVNPQTGTVMFDMYVAFDGVFLNVYVRDGAVHSVDCFDTEGVPPRTINDPVAAAEYLRYASIAAQTNGGHGDPNALICQKEPHPRGSRCKQCSRGVRASQERRIEGLHGQRRIPMGTDG